MIISVAGGTRTGGKKIEVDEQKVPAPANHRDRESTVQPLSQRSWYVNCGNCTMAHKSRSLLSIQPGDRHRVRLLGVRVRVIGWFGSDYWCGDEFQIEQSPKSPNGPSLSPAPPPRTYSPPNSTLLFWVCYLLRSGRVFWWLSLTGRTKTRGPFPHNSVSNAPPVRSPKGRAKPLQTVRPPSLCECSFPL